VGRGRRITGFLGGGEAAAQKTHKKSPFPPLAGERG